MSSELEIVASAAFGIIAGGSSGFLGIGGGALLPPLLVFALSIEQHRAQGISLAALLPPVGLPAVLAYRKAGVRIDLALAGLLIVGFLVGGYGGAWLAHRVPARELRWTFAAFLLILAWRATREPPTSAAEETSRARKLAWGLPIGLLAGIMSGLLGVGGGLVTIPLLQKLPRLGRLEAQATTLAMMLPPIGLPAVFVYAREQGGLPWELLAAVACGFTVGAALGARAAGRVPERLARRIYASLLVIIGLMLMVHG